MSESPDRAPSASDDNGGRYFLRDDIANITEDGDFGHYQYVQTIAETVREVDPPWQIALYGRWGTGKSSILDAVEDELETGETANEYIKFDAWKHAEDSIRTEFLLTLNRKLGTDQPVIQPQTIEEKLLDVSVTETTPDTDDLDKLEGAYQLLRDQAKDLGKHFRDNIVVIVVILLFVVVHQLVTRLQSPIPNTVADVLLLTFAGGALASELFRGVGGTNTYQRMENPRQGWSGAYETLFERILNEHSSDGDSPEQYVIAIDNLDRCEPEAVYDVLISMKTFFDGKDNECVYIVPCDADRLRDHVSAANIVDGEKDLVEGEPKDEDEFLRKFFQTTIHLPPLEVPDLESFANDQFEKLQPDRRPDHQAAVVDVLMKLKSPTPRRVKHLINRFVSYLTLAERLEDAGLMKYNTVTENEPFLMKTLILQEDYNLVYRYIRTQPSEYTKLAKIAAAEGDGVYSENPEVTSDGGVNTSPAPSDEYKQRPEPELEDEQLTQRSLTDLIDESAGVLEFLQETSEYDEKDPEPFFYLGDASFAEIFGRYNQVKDALENADAEQAAKALDESYNGTDWELEQFAADLYSREEGSGIRDSTTIATGFKLLGSLETSAQTQAFGRGFASELDESTLENIVDSFDPHGVWATVWEGYINEQDTVGVRPIIEYALSEELQEQGSIPRTYFTTMLKTVGDAETSNERALAGKLRESIGPALSEEPAGTVRGLAMTLNTLDHTRRTSRVVMRNELHKRLRQVLPAADENGVNADVFEALLDVDPVLSQAPGVESPESLTREFFISVTDACLGSSEVGEAAYNTVGRLRHAELSRLEPNTPEVWRVHTSFATHVHCATTELPPVALSLLDLWFDLLDEDLLPYGQPEDELVPDNDWSDELTVENTFTELLSIDNEDDRIRVSDGLIAESRDLSVLNKNSILTAYLQNIPELIEDEDVIAALELADSGELAPLEEHLLTVCGEGESLGRWASIMVELPEKAVGAHEVLVEECIVAASESRETNTAFVEYPALQWDVLTEHPTLRDRYIEVLERGFATGQTNAQSMTAAALSQLDDGAEIKPQLVRRAIQTVEHEYGRGGRPARALDEFVERQLAAGTLGELAADTDLESLAEWRAEFVRTANAEEDRREVLRLLLVQFETYPDLLDSTILQSVVNALEDEYPTERMNPFAEECQQIMQLEART